MIHRHAQTPFGISASEHISGAETGSMETLPITTTERSCYSVSDAEIKCAVDVPKVEPLTPIAIFYGFNRHLTHQRGCWFQSFYLRLVQDCGSKLLGRFARAVGLVASAARSGEALQPVMMTSCRLKPDKQRASRLLSVRSHFDMDRLSK